MWALRVTLVSEESVEGWMSTANLGKTCLTHVSPQATKIKNICWSSRKCYWPSCERFDHGLVGTCSNSNGTTYKLFNYFYLCVKNCKYWWINHIRETTCKQLEEFSIVRKLKISVSLPCESQYGSWMTLDFTLDYF